VQLEGADSENARNHSSTAGTELIELAKIVSRTLAREDASELDEGFSVRVNVERKAADETIDVTLAIYCSSKGECLGVFDAVEMVCRPCTDHEANSCLMSGG
jgi:hypothetical protein